jgi:hypothetical protein
MASTPCFEQEPEQIVAAEHDGEPRRRRGPVERGAIILLLIGGIVIPVIGWFVGALLLWVSHAWTPRDKLIGTLLVPGGLLPAAWLVFAPVSVETCGSTGNGAVTCTGGLSLAHRILLIAISVAVVVIPFVTAVYLARRAHPAG